MITRSPFQDYRAPAFYMVTMTTHDRRPWFGTCADNRCTLNPDGWLIHDLWHRIPRDYPLIAVSTLCIMPDHLHGILHVTAQMTKPLGVAIRAFKSQATSALRQRRSDPALTLWAPGYNDRCVWRRDALHAFTRYIMDNPRRHCLRRAHPDLFRAVADLRHPALPPDRAWAGYGNRFLLDRPERRAIRVSRKATPDDTAALLADVLRGAAQGVVTVSPFISPGEKAIATAILAAPCGDVILMKPDPFPPLFKPQGRYFDLCVQGRLLILSSPLTCPSSSSVRVHADRAGITRSICLAMNAACAHIATDQQ
ncbi:MAG: transposase [Kiritimatiellaeota bacterium]|nr:transposase [Kiritimatiellota bacterium]